MAKAEFLRKRAEAFLKEAEYDISQKQWFLAAFHFEQSLQLYLKYYLFLKLADFPKTHSLRVLLKGIGKAYKREREVENLIKENEEIVATLEEAYITARYLPVEFTVSQIKKIESFVKKTIKFLKNFKQ